MSAAYRCDQCGRFHSGKPETSIGNTDFEVLIKPKNKTISNTGYSNTASFIISTNVAIPMPDLCLTCLPKKIIAICNEALADKTKK